MQYATVTNGRFNIMAPAFMPTTAKQVKKIKDSDIYCADLITHDVSTKKKSRSLRHKGKNLNPAEDSKMMGFEKLKKLMQSADSCQIIDSAKF